MQKTSHCGNATDGDELHESQPSQQGYDIHPTSKSWSDILKSWAPTGNRAFLFTILALVMLPVGVIHLAQTGDPRFIMIVFGTVSLYCGIPIKEVVSLFFRDKNEVG